MANADVPRGFRPVRTLSGAPVSGKMEVFPVGSDNAERMAVGDAVNLESDGELALAATNDAVLGVIMGFGDASNVEFGAADGFDPENLDSPSVRAASTAKNVLVCLADDVVFSCQTDDGSITDPVRGVAYDLVATASTTQNISQMEIDTQTTTNGDFMVVEIPTFNSANGTTNSGYNDTGAVNAEIYGIFTDTQFAQA